MKKSAKYTVSIGIPAHNEEANISYLLKRIVSQREEGFVINEIIVVSDGSTDSTVTRVKAFMDKRVKLIDWKTRQGLGSAQNEIVKRAGGNILVMLDADVLPQGQNFIKEIIAPVIKNPQVALVGAATVPLPTRTFVERVITNSHNFKQFLYRRINHTDTIYLCHGRARAFARKLYKQIVWPYDCPVDSYSYLYNKSLGYGFAYAFRARVWFRSPATISDHVRQSNRYFTGQKKLTRHFSNDFVNQAYHIPKMIMLRSLVYYWFKCPISLPAYILLMLYIKILYKYDIADNSKYQLSLSSKKVL